MTDTYAGYPRSVNEVRSTRSGKASDWSPREALISLLRNIDEGHCDPESLVVVFREKREGGYWSDFVSACSDTTTMLGLLELTKVLVCRGMR